MRRKLKEQTQESLADFDYTLRETSYLGVRPGDILEFTYNGSARTGLVVRSKRTGTGVFLSKRYNRLLNIILVETLSDAMFTLMVNNLYKNSTACSYHSPKILSLFLGKTNFRTFDVANVSNILTIDITKQ
jgi:hypothetical protein|tara:strand:- start:881 stop:1273 length:393 start_codon:yes stop_codon:yes gene_type:complete